MTVSVVTGLLAGNLGCILSAIVGFYIGYKANQFVYWIGNRRDKAKAKV